MHWSKWKGLAVLLSLTCAGVACVGLVYSQQTAPRPAAADNDPSKFVFIEEPGKPKVECLVLRTYRTPNGQTALDVQVLGTGEVMTVIDSNAPAPPKTGLLPWNRNKQQPGMPAEYVQETLVSGPSGQGVQQAGQVQAVASPMVPEEYRTIQEQGKPAQKCRVVAKWRDADGNANCQCQVLETGETITLVEMGPAQPGAGGTGKAMAMRIFHWGRNTTPPAGTPLPPPPPVVAVAQPQMPMQQVQIMEPVRPSFGERVKDWFSNTFGQQKASPVVEPAKDTVKPPQVAKGADNSTEVVKLPDPPKPVDGAKTPVFPKAPEAPVIATTPKGPPEPIKQWAASDTAAQFGGKPSNDPLQPPVIKGPPLPTVTLPPGSAPLPPSLAQLAADSGKTSAPAVIAKTPPAVVAPMVAPSVLPPPSPPAAQTLPVSKTTTGKTSDPLADPASFAKGAAAKEFSGAPGQPSLPNVPPTATSPASASDSKVPLGAGSVVAAANGGSPQYLPVPIMTVPQTAPPRPPVAQVPRAPESAPDPTWYVNAFTPPLPPNAVSQQAMMQQQQMQQQIVQQQMMMAQQRTMMQGGAPMMPPMMPYDMMPGRGMVPAGYQGPMPPNPTGGTPPAMPMVPPGYLPMQMPMQGPTPMPYGNPVMDRPGLSLSNGTPSQLMQTLRLSLYPSQREEATNLLAVCDWRANPQVIMALTTAAREDPAPTVRCACVLALMRMGVASEQVVQTLNQCKSDADPRVRQEAERAMGRVVQAGVRQ